MNRIILVGLFVAHSASYRTTKASKSHFKLVSFSFSISMACTINKIHHTKRDSLANTHIASDKSQSATRWKKKNQNHSASEINLRKIEARNEKLIYTNTYEENTFAVMKWFRWHTLSTLHIEIVYITEIAAIRCHARGYGFWVEHKDEQPMEQISW